MSSTFTDLLSLSLYGLDGPWQDNNYMYARFISVEAADASVPADAEEFPQRLPHADAHQLGLPRPVVG